MIDPQDRLCRSVGLCSGPAEDAENDMKTFLAGRLHSLSPYISTFFGIHEDDEDSFI